VVDGYAATSPADAALWRLVRYEGADVGCLLLADHPRSRQWELMYTGINPEARGRGFGRMIIRQAQWMARSANCRRIVLAVDRANTPAVDIYESAGFVEWDRRNVWMKRIAFRQGG
jgi:ribosomal protein S18 acetylase RimI-like enzyme